MTDPKVVQKKPYIKDETPGMKAWCACGHSQNQLYCDGSHKTKAADLSPVRVEIKEPKKVAWCGCKHSGAKPFCDGSHNRLPA